MAEQRVLIEGMFPPGSTLPVNGTLTTTPSGTQDVNIVTPTTFPVSGTVTTTPSGTQNVSITGSSAVLQTTPIGTIVGAFGFSLANITGVTGANNFISLFNPVGSGVVLTLTGSFTSSGIASGGSSATTEPMRGHRITTATGGTLQAASAINKFSTAYPNPLAEIRTGNPTVTLGAAVWNSPPVISATVGVTPVHTVIPMPGVPFRLAEGEGVCMRTDAGDTDQRWNLGLTWMET